MRSPREVITELEQDLRRAPARKVLYLEGRTDVPIFLALLGRPIEAVSPEGVELRGVWIRGLGTRRGSGGQSVRSRARIAHEEGHRSIRGLVDGDGDEYESLLARFESSGEGEPRRWPTYCIENWLPQVGWPPGWGDEPSWSDVLGDYVPYAALNRVQAIVQQELVSLGLEKYRHPAQGSLDTVDEVRERLRGIDASSRERVDVASTFDVEVARCQDAIARSLRHGHALINGKWLVEHYAPSICRDGPERCRQAWTDHVAGLGGHPDVLGWWERFVQS